jgi:hypothetical protein
MAELKTAAQFTVSNLSRALEGLFRNGRNTTFSRQSLLRFDEMIHRGLSIGY